jgi:diguanylate cyclase (GGDEF)-like protein
MLDIDHFKRLNDSFGHQAGDAFLKKFGEFLCRRTRGQDVACRYGGEEFVLILSGASLETAKQRAELLREEAKKLAVQYEGHVLGSITLSVGVAASPVHGSTAEDLLRTADAALYRAKTKGRNLVVVGHLGASDVRPVRFRKPALRSVPARHQAVSAAPGGVQVPPRVPRFPRLSDTKTPDQDTQQSEYLDRVEEPGISVA